MSTTGSKCGLEVESIISVNAEAITGEISAENITVLNAGDIVMVTKSVETQIASVNATSITAGTITATVRMTSPDIEVTARGTGYTLKINTSVGMQITATGTTRTMTVTDSKVKIQSTTGVYSVLYELGLDVYYGTGGPHAGCGAGPGQAVMQLSYSSGGPVITAQTNSTAASIQMTGANAYIDLTDTTTSYVKAAKYRHTVNAGAVTILATAPSSIYAYGPDGSLIGRIPIFT